VGAWQPPPTLLRSRDRGGATRGTRRRGVRGSKNPREANPSTVGGRRSLTRTVDARRARAVGPRSGSAGEANPKRGAPGFGPGSGRTGKTARLGHERARRGALGATKALLGRHHETLKGKSTPREPGRARATVLAHRGTAASLWRGRRQEPQRAVTRKGGGRPGRPPGSIG